VRYADRFGMGVMPAVPSLALGSGELTMLSLVSAFGVFANAGTLVPSTLIRRVTDSAGEVLYEARPQPEEVVSPTTAHLVTSMLEDVVDAGTGAQARQLGFRLPAAGKTGTTNDYRDAWFIGYTPQLLAGVWVGHDRPRTIVQRGYAAQIAVPLWTRFMIAATRGDAPERFTAPATVTSATICPISGRLATDACRREHAAVYTEYFERGTEPIDSCPYHILHSRPPLTLAATTIAPVRPGAPAPSVAAPAPAAVAVAAVPQASEPISVEPQPPAPPKKRGFWSRVFGRR
jgi:penicillin-binding protein 1A